MEQSAAGRRPLPSGSEESDKIGRRRNVIAAVYATKEDGNRLFKEKNYKLAYKVYERGVLIINGMYQLNDKDEDEMEKVECLLDLNMALVSLKMDNYIV